MMSDTPEQCSIDLQQCCVSDQHTHVMIIYLSSYFYDMVILKDCSYNDMQLIQRKSYENLILTRNSHFCFIHDANRTLKDQGLCEYSYFCYKCWKNLRQVFRSCSWLNISCDVQAGSLAYLKLIFLKIVEGCDDTWWMFLSPPADNPIFEQVPIFNNQKILN